MSTRNRRSFRRPATTRTARRRRGRHVPPERPPATITTFPWASEPEWEQDVWGAAAIELELVERPVITGDALEPA